MSLLFLFFLLSWGLLSHFRFEGMCPSFVGNSLIIFLFMIASTTFLFLVSGVCLSIGCWITWINSLIFWSPLSYCPCVFFALLSRRFDFSCLHSVDFSCLFLLCFKVCSDLCVSYHFFGPLFLVPWLYPVLLQLWRLAGGWLGELVSSGFRLFICSFLHCLFFWAFSFFSVVLIFVLNIFLRYLEIFSYLFIFKSEAQKSSRKFCG